MKSLGTLLASALLVCNGTATAYELQTHTTLSVEAAFQSILGDEQRRQAIGLRYSIDSTNQAQIFAGSQGEPTSIRDLISNGARYEDDFPPGPLYHFYDPRTNSPLYINAGDYPSAKASYVDQLNAHARTSPDWVVLGQGAAPFDINPFSFPKARAYFFSAVSAQDKMHRDLFTGLLFDSLGRMIHHIQDMAQPQHVRNDNHLSAKFADAACSLGFDAFQLCQSYLALRRESAYESWTERQEIRTHLPMRGYDPVYPGVGSAADGLTVFTSPRHFWTNAGKGIAEFTNRNFFSSGTMDQSPPSTIGPYDVDVKTLCAGAIPTCGAASPDAVVTFFPSYVDDQFRPADGPWLHQYAASSSIFDPEFKTYASQRLTTVNRFTFARDHELLIPRAVAYSAGLLNYFFRGEMEVKASDEGVYAIVDHAPANLSQNGCGTPCGFRKIKFKVRNTTPTDDMVNDPSSPGILIVVAKYHLNLCFQADLSGEFGAIGYRDASCRSANELVVVSNPIQVLSIGRIFPAQALEFTFDAKAPIPINATDLFLQVVYKGTLGKELNGAVAVTTVDMQEPTFLIFNNDNDYFNVYNMDGSYSSTYPYLPAPGRASVHIDLRFNQSSQSPVATNSQLDPGYYHRLAILTDREFLPYWIVEQYIGSDPDTREFMLAASENQTDADDQSFNFPVYVPLRRTTPTAFAYEADEDGEAIYWVPGHMCADDSTRCNAEDKTVGAVVRRYPPFRQPTPVPMDIEF